MHSKKPTSSVAQTQNAPQLINGNASVQQRFFLLYKSLKNTNKYFHKMLQQLFACLLIAMCIMHSGKLQCAQIKSYSKKMW